MPPRDSRLSLDANLVLFLLIVAAVLLLIVTRLDQDSQPVQGFGGASAFSGPILYFESGDLLLGFSAGAVNLTTPDSAVLIEFVDPSGGMPQVIYNAYQSSESGIADQLGQVQYTELWHGINLTCTGNPGGLATCIYNLAPMADPGLIRVRYSVPVTIEADGGLRLSLPDETLFEAPPSAWQYNNDQWVSIPSSYVVAQTPAGEEVRLNLGDYDPVYPLAIGPVLMLEER